MPYQPRFAITPECLKTLEKIQLLHARIQEAAKDLRWLPSLAKDIRARIAHSSTAIEGNPLNLKEVQTTLEGRPPGGASERSVQEIRNFAEVLRYLERLSGLSKIETRHVLNIHRILGEANALDRGPMGYYRNYGIQVGTHIGPTAAEVPGLMEELLEWLDGEGQKWPPVVSSAVLHFRFEWIHPFGDGNGRTGRALALLELYRRRFDSHHIFAVDEIFWERRPAYYAALRKVEQDPARDQTSWIEFVAQAILQALERTWKKIQSQRAGPGQKQIPLTPRQEQLMKLLKKRPRRMAEIQKALGVTRAGAHHILKPLLKAKWVRHEGSSKTGVYR